MRESLGGVPRHLGACELLRPLGSGGTGTVYLAQLTAEQPYAAAGTKVAVKVLHPDRIESETVLRRFLREAELGRSLTHASVVRTYEVDRLEADGTTLHYLVMEYVEGRTLRDFMKQLGTLPEALLQDLAIQITGALEAVHSIGATHRDLKPGNILITPDYQVKLMDLGVALLTENNTRLTRAGYFVGTILYAAPEQVRGERVGSAADLYSLGVVLYEAATGVQPFEAANAQATIQRQLRHVPPKAGHLNQDLTPWIEEVIACLMSKDPAQRIGSATDLLEVLADGEASRWWRNRQSALRDSSEPRPGLRRIGVGRQAGFVGRFTELQTLRALFQEVKSGNGRVLLVEGEAGVGKTRLIDEFVRHLDAEQEELHLLYGSNAPGRVAGANGALTRSVVDHFGRAELEEKLGRYLVATPRLVPGFAALLTGAPPPEGAEPLSSDAIHALFVYLASVLAADRPLVWVVEDLHFATADSRNLFQSLAREVLDQPILLLATTRAGLPSDEVAGLERLDYFRRLSMGRLSSRQVVRLLRGLLSSEPAAESLGRKLALKSDGNPFFIVEMVRELKERKLLRPGADGETYTLTGELTPAIVPASVRDLLLSRLRPLDREDRALLDVGAVEGFAFDADLIARVREMKRLQVLEALAEIERRTGVIRATGSGFRFDHHQLQEVIYDSLPQLLRVECHGRLAEAYEEREGLAEVPAEEMSGEDAVFLSAHYLRGGKVAKGTRNVLRALEHLGNQYQNEALLDLAETALEALGAANPALRCDICRRQAEVFDLLGRREEQSRAVDNALASAREAEDEVRLGWAELALGRLRVAQEDYNGAREVLEKAIARATRTGTVHQQASAMGLLGTALANLGEFDRARHHWRRQLDLAQKLGDQRFTAVASFHVGSALLALGRYESAREQFEKSIEVFQEINLLQAQARVTALLGVCYRNLGHYFQAREVLLRSLEISREISFREGELLGLANLAELALDEGRVQEAKHYLDSYLNRCRILQMRHYEGYGLLYLGELARCRGEAAEAERLYNDALVLQQGLGVRRAVAQTSLALGRLLIERGRSDEARELLVEASDLVAEYFLDQPGPLPQTYLAVLGEAPLNAVEIPGQTPVFLRAEAHAVLFQAGAGAEHLEEARTLLAGMCSHLKEPEQENFWRMNPTARMVQRLGGTEEDAAPETVEAPLGSPGPSKPSAKTDSPQG